MGLRARLTVAYDRAWLAWHKIDETIPRQQDLIDDVDTGLHKLRRRLTERFDHRGGSSTQGSDVRQSRRPTSKSR